MYFEFLQGHGPQTALANICTTFREHIAPEGSTIHRSHERFRSRQGQAWSLIFPREIIPPPSGRVGYDPPLSLPLINFLNLLIFSTFHVIYVPLLV